MGDETIDFMNLDLNLGPGPDSDPNPETDSTIGSGPINLEDWVEEPVHRVRDTARPRGRHRWRWRPLDPLETQNIALELIQLRANSSNDGTRLQTGEGSGASTIKTPLENKTLVTENEGLGKKDDEEKNNGDAISFFDCNICLDLSKDPVVTCCGHLFCWSCLYRWLHVHSDAKECPVCKGQVTLKNVTPIYGRGTNIRDTETDSNLKIPLRPHAHRVESLRQSLRRNAIAIPMEEMIRRLGNRFDLSRSNSELAPQEPDNNGNENGNTNPPDRSHHSFLNRIMTSRGMRRELGQNGFLPPDEVVDLTRAASPEPPRESRRLPSLLLRRSQIHRAATFSSISSAFNTAEGLVEAYFLNHPTGRNNQENPNPPPIPVDDRDSYSSIVAVMNSESQTADNAVEIDSMVSLSTSTSRRRNDASRVSDVDSGDSRAPRRRRLN